VKISIQFCEPCGYRPRAEAVGKRLRELTGADIELVHGHGGVFEVTLDGALKFSKKKTGRFPEDAEIDALAKG